MNNEGTVVNICNDALSVASQLGRLDLVTILLGVISVLIVFGGIVAFFEVRSKAKKAAIEAAAGVAATTAEGVANKYLQDQLPLILQEYQDLIKSMVNADIANDIANAQENETRS